MEALTKEIITKTISTAMELILGLMAEFTVASGQIIRWMATERSPGLMDECIEVTTRMTLSKDMESSRGQTVENIEEAGIKASSTGKVCTLRTEKPVKASGISANA